MPLGFYSRRNGTYPHFVFELFSVLFPPSLVGRTLGEIKIGDLTGLNVIGIQQNGRLVTSPAPSTILAKENELLMMGSTHAREGFVKAFSK